MKTILLASINQTLVLFGTPTTVVLSNAYSYTFVALFGSGVYTFTESGSLPTGLSFADNGDGTATISGTTSVPGNFPITITVQDSNRNKISKNFTLSVQPLPLTISGHIAGGIIGSAASGTYTISGGVSPYVVTVSSGASPCDGNFSNTGAAQGNWQTPSGTHTWNVHVVDSAAAAVDLSDSCTNSYATLTLTGTYPAAYVSIAYSNDLTIAGGNGTYSNPRITTGSLPPGLSLSIVGSALRLSGTPTTANATAYSFTAAVDSGDGQTATSAQSVSSWGPSLLYAASERGGWWDPSDLSTLWQDTAGTVAVTAVGQSVALMQDKSGNGNHVTQATSGKRPILRRDGHNYYLAFTEANSTCLRIAASSVLALRTLSLMGVTGYRLSGGTNVANCSLWSRTLFNPGDGRYWYGPPSNTSEEGGYIGFSGAAHTNTYAITGGSGYRVATYTLDRAIGSNNLRLNGASVQSTSFTPDNGNDLNTAYDFIVGGYNNTSNTGEQDYANARFYGLMLRIAAIDTTMRGNAETWLTAKMASPSHKISLLNFDGTNGSTTFTDDVLGGTWSIGGGSPVISTAQSVFGGSSLRLPGGAWVLSPVSEEYSMGNRDFTWRCRFRYDSLGAFQTIMCNRVDNTNHTDQITVGIESNGKVYVYSNAFLVEAVSGIAANTWAAMELSCANGVGKLFVNGTQVGANFTVPALVNSRMSIGANINGSEVLTGYVDAFEVLDYAEHTANFTPAASASTYPP